MSEADRNKQILKEAFDVWHETRGGSIDHWMSIMSDKRVRHLVVRDDDRITGVISIGDVVKAIIDDQQFTIEQLKTYISGRG